MKTTSEIIEHELRGVNENINILGKPRFWEKKKKDALLYWTGQRDALLRQRMLNQIEEMKPRRQQNEQENIRTNLCF